MPMLMLTHISLRASRANAHRPSPYEITLEGTNRADIAARRTHLPFLTADGGPFADVTYERADKGVTFHGLRDVTVTATGDNTMNVTVEQGNSWDFDLPRGSTHNTMNIDYAVRLALAWARTGLESVNQRFRMPALTDEI